MHSMQPKQIHRTIAAALWLSSLAFILTWSNEGLAYPWMIRHEYTGCALCHTDPSGGFLLTQYGRAQTQTLLSSLDRGPEGAEVDSRSQFAYGVPLPDWLNLGFTARYLYMHLKAQGSPGIWKDFWMQSDARAAAQFEKFELAASLGFSPAGALPAAITSRPNDNFVSREFWVGYDLDDDRNYRIRAGRMYLPFGVRSVEHTLFVRNATQTDLDSQQQYGLSFFHQSDTYRFEVMGIAGNYQVRPDIYRQRGYSTYVEFNLATRLGVGLSSLVTYQGLSTDPNVSGARIRGAHGPFVRFAPISSLALMSEWDVLHNGPVSGGRSALGMAGVVQADWEFVRGLHMVVTPEIYLLNAHDGTLAYRGWVTAAWYAIPHFDFRLDVINARDVIGSTKVGTTTILGQVHVSL